MNDLARERNRRSRVTPGHRPLVVGAHALDQWCLAVVLAILHLAGTEASKSLNEAHVNGCCGANPFIVAWWEECGSIEPGPHDGRARERKEGWISRFLDEFLRLQGRSCALAMIHDGQ